MASDKQIRIALDRTRKAMELRPGIALGTMKTRTRLENGVKCVSRNDDWSFEMDEPTAAGGEDFAPSPGVYGLGALTGCVAISIKSLAVQSEVSIRAIDIDAEGDFDDRGFFQMDGVPPGYKEIRLNIDVDSPAPIEKVREVVEEALKVSTWFNMFSRGQKVSVNISATAGAKTATG